MADPIPYVVAEGGSAGAAPDGAIPIGLYGAGGGGGGGAVDSVNGKVGDVELVIADIPELQAELDAKALASEVIEFAGTVSAALTNVESDLASKANSVDVTNSLAGKASTTDLDNVNTKVDDAQFTANQAVAGLDGKLDDSQIITAMNVRGIAWHEFIPNGGTVTNPTPFMVIIEDE